MIPAPATVNPRLVPDKAQAAFKIWLRGFVTGAKELQAFDAGEIDAVMDRDSGRALLLPEAQGALHDASRLVLGTLDVLPGEVCVIDSAGVVVMANKAWRRSGAAHGRAGLDVRAGENIFAACRDAPASERNHADAVAAGLRDVLGGVRQSGTFQYECPSTRGGSAFTLTLATVSAPGPVNALLTREWHGDHVKPATPRERIRGTSHRSVTVKRAESQNRLLTAMTAPEYTRLTGGLESVVVTSGEVLHEPGDLVRDVYFPLDCVVSLLTLVEGRRALEVGLVGREGMIGARVAFGGTESSVRALVQSTGTILRVKTARFLREFRRNESLQWSLLQFTSRLMDQISQTAACNRFHVVAERLARCLLMTAERTRSATFPLTHGFIAEMLGVRREAVTVAAIELQRRGCIRYRRGNITILDRRVLEAASCSCFRHLQSMDA